MIIHLCLFLCVVIYSQVPVCSAGVTNETCHPMQFSCSNGRCISLAWKCDGDDDCHDLSDEIGCPSTTCSENSFKCDNGKCIPNRWLCDDSSECRDDSDEKPELCRNRQCDGHMCANSSKCIPLLWKCDGTCDCPYDDDEKDCSDVCDPGSEFKCNNSQCVAAEWKCDGKFDCNDKSDESDCPQTECVAGEKMCNNKECINELWWCDGDVDCHDKSDENNCTSNNVSSLCGVKEFQCHLPISDVKCIHIEWKCDGHDDCFDGSDEKECQHSCSSDERMCGTSCVKIDYFCDGDIDCDDGEDEKNCNITVTPPSQCNVDEFDCGDKCIAKQLICDGAIDCKNGADEALGLYCPSQTNNSCTDNNGGCQQICIPNTKEKLGRKCECHIGFEMINSETECEDIDECQISGTCSQNCTNTKGSYKCECVPGYTLINHRYCKATEGNHPELILSDRHSLRRYHLDTFHYSFLLQQIVDGAVAMDFDIRNKTVFWADLHSEKVFSASLESNDTEVIVDNFTVPDGLAVDWIHRNMYMTDTILDRIVVARLDGACHKTLINDNLDEPRALVVDPNSGWMYWTDWGYIPKIEKCGMNGQNRTVIITEGIFWPNGLTIDYIQKRLYWVDAKLHSIGSSDLDGNHFKLILKNHRKLGHPFAVTVFEDHLYWTDWMTSAVHRVSKFGRDDVSTIALDLKEPMAIHVYHISRQPDSINNCGDNNGGCSHLCLPVPGVETTSLISKRSECACPDSMILDGQFNCIQSSETSTSMKIPQATDDSKPVSQQTSRTDLTTPVKPGADTTDKSEADLSTAKTVSEAPSVNKTHVEMGQRDNEGYIALIAIVALLTFGIAVIVAICLLLKRHKSRNVKSMNFDNPVYRKTTTEDHLIMEKSGSRSSLPQSMQPLNQDNDIV